MSEKLQNQLKALCADPNKLKMLLQGLTQNQRDVFTNSLQELSDGRRDQPETEEMVNLIYLLQTANDKTSAIKLLEKFNFGDRDNIRRNFNRNKKKYPNPIEKDDGLKNAIKHGLLKMPVLKKDSN